MRRPRPSAMSLTLWSECEEARLASRTPRLTNIGLRLHPRGTRSCTTVVPDFSEGWAQALAAVLRFGFESKTRTAFRPALSGGEGRGRLVMMTHQDRHHQRFARGSHLRYQSHKPAGECGHNRSHRAESSTSDRPCAAERVTTSRVRHQVESLRRPRQCFTQE